MKRKAEWCEERSHALATALVKTVKLSAVMAAAYAAQQLSKKLKGATAVKEIQNELITGAVEDLQATVQADICENSGGGACPLETPAEVDGTPTKMTVGRALRNNKQDGSPSSNKRFDGQFMVLLVPDNFVFTPPEKHTSALCKKVPNDAHIAYAQFNYLKSVHIGKCGS